VLDQFASNYGFLEEVDWQGIFKSFYESVRMRIKCRDVTKISRERLFCIDKKLYKIEITIDLPRVPKLERKDGGDGDDKDEGGDDKDSLYDVNEDQFDSMNVDRSEKRAKDQPSNGKQYKHNGQNSKSRVIVAEEDMQGDDGEIGGIRGQESGVEIGDSQMEQDLLSHNGEQAEQREQI
jgi:hypothetical protein